MALTGTEFKEDLEMAESKPGEKTVGIRRKRSSLRWAEKEGFYINA